ncbi:menaquinone biosynthetic enzyme MqnA/MqnD family protein [Legionella nautarum]|uniref:menaquinone biosynthetic enzyme MqnA/MqnD family protein n=1 Tax=Legionella nautarum TaxID=45070 RepID=UPI00138F25D0|nr:menaquinone biosynthesis protein [Legionella nautarum]
MIDNYLIDKAKNNKINLGIIDYFINHPIVGLLLKEKNLQKNYGIKIIKGVPTQINSALLNGRVDIANVSSFAFGCHCDKWLLLPNFSVSSSGPVRSVLLFSHYHRWDQLDGRNIAITNQSATSVGLLKLLCHEKYKINPQFVVSKSNLDVMLNENSAALIIGDSAFKEGILRRSFGGRTPYMYDLGQEWNNWLHYPFVYSVWAVRREIAKQVIDSECLSLLYESKSYGKISLDELAKLEMQKTNLPYSACKDYLKNISYELTLKHLCGLKIFLELTVAGFRWENIKFLCDSS